MRVVYFPWISQNNEKLALKTLSNGTIENVPGAFVHVEEWRPLFYKGHPGDTVPTKNKAFSRARKTLKEKGIIEVSNGYYSIRDSGTSAGHW